MIISRTPYRISFLGGGTDYPAWYRTHGGAVLATTINKYCYITCRYLPPFFEHRIRVVYSKTETCQHAHELQHPAAREVLRYLDIDRGIEIHHDGDLPARSGIGSSSAFTVGLLHALYALKGQMPTKKQLASESIHIEQNVLHESVGSQDQVLAAHGGFNHVTFAPNGELSVRPMTLSADRLSELQSHLMLFFTGVKRTASSVASSYVNNLLEKEDQLHRMNAIVDEGIELLTGSKPIVGFGELLHEAWCAKRSLSHKVSNDLIETMYEQAIDAGAVGGKLLGAGGGGFLLLFVPPERQLAVRAALHGLIYVPFKFEHAGSQIIFFEREEDYADEDYARANQNILAFREMDGGLENALPDTWAPDPVVSRAISD
jgi:D-glycero-alpha-D-manno-heptose-7-phosphate kinase